MNMAFDGIVTRAVVSELNGCLLNGKINKIFEPNKNEILLGIYSCGKNYALNICINPVNYRVHLTTHSKPNPQNVFNFCMVLRKHLTGGTIKKIYMNGLERIIYIDVDCYNDFNDLVTKTIVIELMGKHSNVILLNSDNTIIDSLRHLDKLDNSLRDILPGYKYSVLDSSKQDFTTSTFDDFYKILQNAESIATALSNYYTGFSKAGISYILNDLHIDIEKFSLDEDYDFSDPSKLDERELKIYNNRGWSYGLFNKEDMALLSEKVQELKKDWHKADNALWDGSRLVEINNKLVILGGTYKNPEIYNVLVINANQETDAEFIKEDFYFEFNRCKKFREVVANICKSIEIMQGEELVRFYDSIDCIYKKGRGRNWIPATLPSDFKDYGYTEGRNERYGSSFRTGKSVSSVQLNEETDNSTDEKVGAIHDTLKFSIDEEYDDWLVNDDGKNNINDLIKEAVALETTGKTGFFYLDKKEPRIFLRSQGTNYPANLKVRVPMSLYALLMIMSIKNQ